MRPSGRERIKMTTARKHVSTNVLTAPRPTRRAGKKVAIAAAVAITALGAGRAMAQLYWDTNGTTVGLGGSGTWSTAATNWNTDSAGGAGTISAWSPNDGTVDAKFGGTTTSAVTLSGAISAHSLEFT